MSNPEQIRADIEATRAELGQDVDALADKVSPAKIVERQKTRVGQALGGLRDKVMGAAEDVGSAVSHGAEATAHGVGAVPRKAARATQGAPLAVGLVALGAGFLIASFTPPTPAEKRAARALKDAAQPIMDQAVDAAKNVASDLKQPAKDAVDQVKQAATDAADTVKTEAKDTTQRVKENVSSSSSTSGSTGSVPGTVPTV